QRLVAHEAARERDLLPLAERELDAARPGGPELRVETRRQTIHDVLRAATLDGAMDRRLIVRPRHVAESDAAPRAELEAIEILKRAGEAPAPIGGRHARQRLPI